MNLKNYIYVTFLSLTAITGFSSCEKDQNAEEAVDKETAVDKWIESTMRENYYWYKDMPSASTLNFLTDPESFFASLLSKSDGKDNYAYSYIESTAATTRSISQTDYSYGFEFEGYRLNSTGDLVAHLLYVAPNSPASEAGLKRGDWIVTMDGKNITSENYQTLYGGKSTELQLADYNMVEGGLELGKKVQLDTAREIEDNPVYYHSIIEWDGKKVGYLVYNHFTAGKTDDDDTYDNELLSLSKEFKSAGVNEFVLDLRYNNGGLLTCAQLICTILAPESALGKTMCYLEYNDKQSPQKGSVSLNRNLITNGANLNLQKVYILVTDRTASASELVINCLKPYMNVVVIGMKTEGKNVGSETYSDDKYEWELHPIVCKIYNSANQSDYESGFTPEYEYDEATTLNKFLPFGNTNEILLGKALSLIDGTYTKSAETKAIQEYPLKLVKIASSLDRKATNGVVITGALVNE